MACLHWDMREGEHRGHRRGTLASDHASQPGANSASRVVKIAAPAAHVPSIESQIRRWAVDHSGISKVFVNVRRHVGPTSPRWVMKSGKVWYQVVNPGRITAARAGSDGHNLFACFGQRMQNGVVLCCGVSFGIFPNVRRRRSNTT